MVFKGHLLCKYGGWGGCRNRFQVAQELSGTPNHRYFLKRIAGTNGRRTAVQIGGVLQYKLEVYCGASLLSQSLEASKAQRYKWWAYCGTNWRCTASTLVFPIGALFLKSIRAFSVVGLRTNSDE